MTCSSKQETIEVHMHVSNLCHCSEKLVFCFNLKTESSRLLSNTGGYFRFFYYCIITGIKLTMKLDCNSSIANFLKRALTSRQDAIHSFADVRSKFTLVIVQTRPSFCVVKNMIWTWQFIMSDVFLFLLLQQCCFASENNKYSVP